MRAGALDAEGPRDVALGGQAGMLGDPGEEVGFGGDLAHGAALSRGAQAVIGESGVSSSPPGTPRPVEGNAEEGSSEPDEGPPGSGEIVAQDAGVDALQLMDLRDLHPLVDLMHGLADQAEFDHRAMILDEARIRGAAGGRQLRPAPGFGLDRARRPAPTDRPAGSGSFRPRSGWSSRSSTPVSSCDAAASARSQSVSDWPLWRVVEADVDRRRGRRPGSRSSPGCRCRSW